MFEVFVADNFNYMDEEATHRHGEFASWAQALSVARAIVDRSLQEVYRPGVGALALSMPTRASGRILSSARFLQANDSRLGNTPKREPKCSARKA